MSPSAVSRTLGERVREARQARDLSQAELGRMVGRSQQAIARIEKGDEDVGASRLKALADALSEPDAPVSVDWLLGDDVA